MHAGVLIENKFGQLIFHQRDNKPGIVNPGKVGIYGGVVEDGETTLETAVRELEEELGLFVQADELEFFTKYIKTKEIHGEDQVSDIFVLKGIDEKQLVPSKTEGRGYVLVSKNDDLQKYDFSIMVRDLIGVYWSLS